MNKYDVVIVGGGPAGMTAAIYAARRALKTLIITKEIGGQVVKTPDIENYPGFNLINGIELANKFTEQAKKFGAEIVHDEVEEISKIKSDFSINCRNNSFVSKSIILAFGKVPRKMGIQGEDEFKGRGVSYCATCDAPFFKNKKVAVVGGGNSALDAALYLSKIAEKVYIIHRRDQYRAENVLIEKVKKAENIEEILNASPKQVIGETTVKNLIVETKDGEKNIDVDGVFVDIGYAVDASLVKNLVDIDENNQIIVDKDQSTKKPGVFAAGDLTNSFYKQIVISAGEGAIAALSVAKYLDELE